MLPVVRQHHHWAFHPETRIRGCPTLATPAIELARLYQIGALEAGGVPWRRGHEHHDPDRRSIVQLFLADVRNRPARDPSQDRGQQVGAYCAAELDVVRPKGLGWAGNEATSVLAGVVVDLPVRVLFEAILKRSVLFRGWWPGATTKMGGLSLGCLRHRGVTLPTLLVPLSGG